MVGISAQIVKRVGAIEKDPHQTRKRTKIVNNRGEKMNTKEAKQEIEWILFYIAFGILLVAHGELCDYILTKVLGGCMELYALTEALKLYLEVRKR